MPIFSRRESDEIDADATQSDDTASDSTVGDADRRDPQARTGPAAHSHEAHDAADHVGPSSADVNDQAHLGFSPAVSETDTEHEVPGDTRADAAIPSEDARDADAVSTEPDSAQPTRHQAASFDHDTPLFADADLERLRIEWREVQGLFVDDPHQAVTRADELVSTTIEQLTAAVSERKQDLESRWRAGESTDTEALRQALRGYRSFFHRVLGAN
ncbi:hypothetical protein [Nocardia pseudobrasiliensis]|uniref:Uncharacterized protein n=1 Tax=Nocardia pseudobrasiliensis TaxID=45979 RepID=A0A370HY26_9NOCA|nr:hypothetical protein [Nocardia pseudobrasiliensis]RDI63405.1 hypothetical protein DFR76_110102 [Nocardia pseudobrasiliensis]